MSDLVLNGERVRPDRAYLVTINSFLANGGDGVSVFTEGSVEAGGIPDLEALETYLRTHPPLAPPPHLRLTRMD